MLTLLNLNEFICGNDYYSRHQSASSKSVKYICVIDKDILTYINITINTKKKTKIYNLLVHHYQ